MSQDTETVGTAPEPSAEELLSIPPRADHLAEELAAAPTGDRADPELASAFFNRAVAYLDRG